MESQVQLSSIQSLKQQSSLQPLQERAIVNQVEGDYAWVSVVDKSGGCETCASKGACGSFNLFKPLLNKKLTKNNNNLKILNTLNLVVGDETIIEISSQTLLKSTFLIYLLPLIMLFVGALMGKQLSGEVMSAMLGIISLLLGLFMVKIILSKTTYKQYLEPRMVISD